MNTHACRFSSSFAVAFATSALLACSGKELDVGTAKQSGATTENAEDSGAAADAGAFPEPIGLTIDGITCAVRWTNTNGIWPGWSLSLTGTCGALGEEVDVTVGSRADVPYPQSCSVATGVNLKIISNLRTLGGTYYYADATKGSCLVESGPTLTAPATGVAFEATTIDVNDPSVVHHVVYRASNAP